MKSVALYARVSSEHQEKLATVQSQVAALVERARNDGHQALPADIYIDDGYSGSTLVRPALERLRDRAAEGGLDLLYVHSPDRLARRYAYQVLLIEELGRCGVTVVFLNGASGRTAEDELLVQVQGVIAEYERAKILERSRRGRLHKARSGSVNALCCAPYGFQYVRKTPTEPACYHVLLHEAKVVRQIFRWFVEDQISVFRIAARLTAAAVPTRTGRACWGTAAVWNLLRNPAYVGRAAYGKTESVPKSVMLRPHRGRSGVPRREKSSARRKPPSEWVTVPVPVMVAEEVFAAAQEQLERNRRLAARNRRGQRYLLQGLVVCAQCGCGFYGRTSGQYYCGGTVAARFGGMPVCRNASVRVQQLDEHVWTSVCQVLQSPHRVVEEWTRRAAEDGATAEARAQRDEAHRMVTVQTRALQRLLDAYEAGALTVEELGERSERVRARIRRAEEDLAQAQADLAHTVELKALAGKLTTFAEQVRAGLDGLDWLQRRQLIRTLVSRVEIDESGATIVYRIPSTPRQPGEPSAGGGVAGEGTAGCLLHSRGQDAVVPGEVEVGPGQDGGQAA